MRLPNSVTRLPMPNGVRYQDQGSLTVPNDSEYGKMWIELKPKRSMLYVLAFCKIFNFSKHVLPLGKFFHFELGRHFNK